MAGIGHNSGQSCAPGQSWRRFAWAKARLALMPVLPVEVVRLRVKRAAELGLPYRTYAGLRASSGDDLIGFLFSNNALRVLRDGQAMPPDRAARLEGLVRCARHALVHPPASPASVALLPQIDHAFAAPLFTARWAQMRADLDSVFATLRQPRDRFVLVGETAIEQEWVAAGRLAGYVPAQVYFG